MEKALENISSFYKKNGLQPPYERIAEQTDLSTATVQRYLTNAVKRPDYTKILSIAKAIGMETADLSLGEDTIEQLNVAQLQDLVLKLREMNVDEVAANNAEWRARLVESDAHHRDEIFRMANAHDAQILRLQESNRAQLDQLRASQEQQLEIFRQLTTVQKAADEKSKDYLKRQVFFWRVVSILLILTLILLLIVDIINPTRGWIRFISDGLKLSRHVFG